MRTALAGVGGLVATLPGAAFLLGMAALAVGEYYFTTYALLSVFFAGAGWLAVVAVLRVSPPTTGGLALSGWVFVALIAVWGLTVLLLGALNVTDLCVGQDNGDGNNDLTACVVQTVLVAVFYSLAVIGGSVAGALVAGFGSAWLMRRLARRTHVLK